MGDHAAERKRQLRRRLLARRQRLSGQAAALRSRTICRHVAALPAFAAARTILYYYPIKREVSPLPLLRQTLGNGHTALLPVVQPARDLTVGVVRAFADLTLGPFGVPAPRHADPHLIREIDLVITPGLAFCQQGFRLGYGGGYYDRFLAGLRAREGLTTVGLIYRWALRRRLPRSRHDERVQLVVSEDGVHHVTAQETP